MFSVQVDKFAGWVGLGDGPIVEVQQTAAVVRQQLCDQAIIENLGQEDLASLLERQLR